MAKYSPGDIIRWLPSGIKDSTPMRFLGANDGRVAVYYLDELLHKYASGEEYHYDEDYFDLNTVIADPIDSLIKALE